MNGWNPQLAALAHLRKKQSHHLNQPVAYFLVILIIFVFSVLRFGVQNTMGVGLVIAFLAFNFISRGRFKFLNNWSKTNGQMSADSSLMEGRILQSVAASVDEILCMNMSAPDISLPLRNSNLVKSKIDYIHRTRCISGVLESAGAGTEIAFCSTYIEAGFTSTYKDSKGQVQTSQNPVYQGLVLVADFPKAVRGWVNLESDKLETLGWLASEWRHLNDSNHVRMENVHFEKGFHVRASSSIDAHLTLTSDVMERLDTFRKRHPDHPFAISLKDKVAVMLLPMKTNPFVIRDNPDLWTHELDRLREASEITASFVRAIEDQAFSVAAVS